MIRFGVIGTNWITEEFIKAAQETGDFALTAVYSRDEQRAKQIAEKYNADNIFTDVQTMAASDRVDAVYIASPNSFHAQQAIDCMNHGKHVLCEKPIASNAQQLRQMIVAAHENNVSFMEAMKSTLMPNYRVIRENLHKIGKVRRYAGSSGKYSSRYDAYKEGTVLNAFNPIFSNGSLMDAGIYCIYPMVELFGRPIHMKATGLILESGVDGEGSAIFKYEDMEAVIMHSKITNSALPSEIQGEDGSIVIDKIGSPDKVEIHYRDGTVENISQPQPNKTMFYEAKEFIDLIKNGKLESSTNSHENSLIAMEIMDEARKQIGLVYPADIDTEN